MNVKILIFVLKLVNEISKRCFHNKYLLTHFETNNLFDILKEIYSIHFIKNKPEN